MYLSQILLDPFSRRVQGRHRTAYQTHRSILTAFAEPLPPDERVLFRREELDDPPAIRLLVQSVMEPDWRRFTVDHVNGLLEEPQVKRYSPVLQAGQVLSFRLLANPTVKRDGRRLGLLREAEQLEWLIRHGKQAGFAIDPGSLRITSRGFLRDKTGNGQTVSLLMVQFDGLLRVTDGEMFEIALHNGIGPGKGLGCGLLSVARLA